YKSKDSGKFFSQIMNLTIEILFIGVALLTLFAKPIVTILSTQAYFEAWKVVPWLALAVLYSSLSSFLGTIYTSSMQTRYLFITTVCGAVVNVISHLVFVRIFGLIGVGISAALAFVIISLMRFRDSRKFIELVVDKWKWVVSQLLLFGEIFCLYLLPTVYGYVSSLIITSIILYVNRGVFLP